MKALCQNCNKLAIWNYAPGKGDRYYCDEHVPRGCSCNIDPDTGEEDQDEKGRFFPCCEYMYDDRGFQVEP